MGARTSADGFQRSREKFLRGRFFIGLPFLIWIDLYLFILLKEDRVADMGTLDELLERSEEMPQLWQGEVREDGVQFEECARGRAHSSATKMYLTEDS